ncbi:MAG: hypothetical protein PHY93_05945 [Bacteriovorax sp.]|nr:hypothetical protein [Bacteriovorax sp.]
MEMQPDVYHHFNIILNNLRKILTLILICASPKALCEEVQKFKKINSSGLNYYQFITADVDMRSAEFKKYQSVQKIANPQIEFPNMRLTHLALEENGKREFVKTYTLNQFGFRKIAINQKAKQHFIMAGDSHIFGHGCNDDETITSFLAEKFPDYQMVNLGISGSAGNSLLFFLDHYNLKTMISSKLDRGIFIYDFSDYLIERMIGSKNFIRWGWMQPAYEINSKGKLVFIDSFNGLWATKFFKFINLIDPNNYFIANLPKITDDHLKLIARIFVEMKKKYLSQTNIANHFYIQLNPFFLEEDNKMIVQKLIVKFKAEGLELLSPGRNKLMAEHIYLRDRHLTPEGHRFYANLITDELKHSKDRLK